MNDYSRPQPSRFLIEKVMDSIRSTERSTESRHAVNGYFYVDIIRKRVMTNSLTIISGSDPCLFLLNLLSNISIYWERPALFVCLETDPEIAYLRLLSIISGINTADVLSRRISPTCFAAIDDAATDLYRAPTFFWGPLSLDMNCLEQEALRLLSEYGKMSLFIDAIPELKPSISEPQGMSPFQRVCDQLGEFAETHNIPVVGGVDRFDVGDVSGLADLMVDVEQHGGEATIRVTDFFQQEESVVRYLECCGRYSEKYYRPWGDKFEKAGAHPARSVIPYNAQSINTDSTG